MTLLRAASAWCLAVTLGIASGWIGNAAADVPVPPLTTRVTDQTATLSAAQQAALEQTLQAFEAKKGSQIAVLIVATTAPETIEQYALRVAEKWKLGRKKIDDGALLLIAKNDRTLRIETGYGLEGALNDATAKRIIAETITPRFKQGDFDGGIRAGVEQMIRVIDGEPLPAPARQRSGGDGIGSIEQYLPVLFVLAMVVGGVLRAALGRLSGAVVTGGIVGVIAWFLVGVVTVASIAGLIALVFTLMGGSALGRAVNGYGGGSFGGGGGGGGNGGFSGGGGGFGGGGASGRW